MAESKTSGLVPTESVEESIHLVRGLRVMLDSDLAELYGVPTGHLNRAVLRNKERFPEDFMFQLSVDEYENLKCQIGIAKPTWGGRKSPPYAFTQEGIAMLSGVLRSRRAVEMNIAIMRAFVRLRALLASHRELDRKVADLEKKYDKQFKAVFDAIRQLLTKPPAPKRREMGFHARIEGDDEKKTSSRKRR